MDKRIKINIGFSIGAVGLLLAAVIFQILGALKHIDLYTYIGEVALSLSATISVPVSLSATFSNLSFQKTVSDNSVKIKKFNETIINLTTKITNIGTVNFINEVSQTPLVKEDALICEAVIKVLQPLEESLCFNGATFEAEIPSLVFERIEDFNTIKQTPFYSTFQNKNLESLYLELFPLIERFVLCFREAMEPVQNNTSYYVAKWKLLDRGYRHKTLNVSVGTVDEAYSNLIKLNKTYVEMSNKFRDFIREYKK